MTPPTEHHVDLTSPLRVHVIGVGGAGMSAIASVLAAMGHTVSGSDLKASSGLDRLRAEGIEVSVGHDAVHVGEVDLVTRSTAVPDHNVEVAEARARGIVVASRADVLSAITRVRPTIAVAGTHGKTTTSSMLGLVLMEAGLNPSFIIGGEVNEIGAGAVWVETEGWFVVEADESDGTFLRLDRGAAVVTSVEPDHLSHWGTESDLIEAFRQFAGDVDGPLVVCVDDEQSRQLVAQVDGAAITYGTHESAAYRVVNYQGDRASSTFDIHGPDGSLGTFQMATPGLYNALNGTAAVLMAMALGADIEAARRALRRFAGVARRFQFRGDRGGVVFVDDYAHLPTEVAAALSAARGGGWDRIVCVFQPHRFTRTADLWEEFGPVFGDADLLVLTDIYAAGEQPQPGVSGQLIVDAVTAAAPDQDMVYLAHRDELVSYLNANLRPGDLCLTLGAGDLTSLPDALLPESPQE